MRLAGFLKRHGRTGITRELQLPERITPLVKIYRHEELARFFAACSDTERALLATFLPTGYCLPANVGRNGLWRIDIQCDGNSRTRR